MYETFRLKQKITYGQLHQFLRDRGFSDRMVTLPNRPTAHVFQYQDTDFLFLLAAHEADELALPHDVVHVRRMLDLKGLVDVDQFDLWMSRAEGQPTVPVTA